MGILVRSMQARASVYPRGVPSLSVKKSGSSRAEHRRGLHSRVYEEKPDPESNDLDASPILERQGLCAVKFAGEFLPNHVPYIAGRKDPVDGPSREGRTRSARQGLAKNS